MILINKILILVISASFVFPVPILGNLYPFDLSIIAYILFAFIARDLYLDKFTSKIIIVGLGGLAISFPFVVFSEYPEESALFIFQLASVIVFLPSFLAVLIKQKLFDFFLRTILGALIILILVIFASFLNLIVFNNPEFFYVEYGWATLRLRVGNLLPSDLNHYLVLGLFLTSVYIRNNIIKLALDALNIGAYLLTQSKTVLVTLLLYLLRFKPVLLTIAGVLVVLNFAVLTEESALVQRVIEFLDDDYGNEDNTTTHRLGMISATIDNLGKFLYAPLFGVDENLPGASESRIASAHNIFLSIIVNLGIPAFIYYFLFFLYYARKVSIKNRVIFYLVLDGVTVFFNPLMTSRITWLPFFVFIYYYNFKNSEQKTLSSNLRICGTQTQPNPIKSI